MSLDDVTDAIMLQAPMSRETVPDTSDDLRNDFQDVRLEPERSDGECRDHDGHDVKSRPLDDQQSTMKKTS